MFTISCESTTDMTLQHFNKREIPVLPYTYTVDGVEYADDMREGNGLAIFYNHLNSGKRPTTSLISVDRYVDFFHPLLEKGDLLHVAFSGGLSQSAENARLAAEALRADFPERKIYVVDSLCACVGYGLFVDTLADLRDGGMSVEQVYEWAMSSRLKVNHQFFSTTLTYFRRSGRISGPAAAIGNLLKLCPLMRLDDQGKIVAYAKAMSESKAIAKTIAEVEELILNGRDYSGKLWIGHSNYVHVATKIAAELKSLYPNADVRTFHIGPVIASHCGPGTLAIFFFGAPRNTPVR